jgi:fermentation-respiration switch protein FrsA (DUF1100 family)
LTVVHGTEDASVDVSAADEISAAATVPCRTHRIEGANHVFNTPNPSAMDHAPSEALSRIAAVLDDVTSGLSGD